jgi:hypothetical protein
VNRLMDLLVGAAFGVKLKPNNQANNPNATGAISEVQRLELRHYKVMPSRTPRALT